MRGPFFKGSFLAVIALSMLVLPDRVLGGDTGDIQTRDVKSIFGVDNNKSFTIKFRKAPLRETLQFLAAIGEVNIMLPEAISGTVTISFRDIALGDAINAIIKANGLDYTIEGGVIRVGKPESFAETGENLRSESFRLNYATARDMITQVKTLLSARGAVFADDRTNSIVVRELPANIDSVRRFIAEVDIRDAQVLIEAKILEATRNFSRALGIQWGVTRPGTRADIQGLEAVGQADSRRDLAFDAPAANPVGGFALVLGRIADGTNIDIQLSAAEDRGDAYIISDPSIVTSNGIAAKIRSGVTILVNASGDINIGAAGAGTSAAGSGAGLKQIETGVELNVTPQISANSFIKLAIGAKTSQPDFSRAVQGIPSIIDNVATTTVLVRDGETTVIGGLTRFSDSVSERRVPGLSRIPLFGNLFKSKNKQKGNTELMVFVRPTIVRTDGIAPAQVRVNEIQRRRESMYLEPLENPVKRDEERQERLSRRRSSGGNKYLEMRRE